MANFQPLKARFLFVLDRMIQDYNVSGTFVDYGCGRGDVAEYLVHNRQFTAGAAYDPAMVTQSPRVLDDSRSLIYTNNRKELGSAYDLALLFDVIEHVANPWQLLEEISNHTRDKAWMVVSVPYNRREWGDDDEFYGHLRRLSRQGVVNMLDQAGWQVVRMLDPTFPSFWFIRRVYLMTEKLRRHSPPIETESEIRRTNISARNNAWGTNSRAAHWLSRSTFIWRLCQYFDVYFESLFLGFNLLVLCRKAGVSLLCGVCRRADITFSWSCAQGSVWICPHCGSQQMEARQSDSVSLSRLPACTRGVKKWVGKWRLRSFRSQMPVAGRLLYVYARSGNRGTEDDDSHLITRVDSLEQVTNSEQAFDGIIALHALERTEKLAGSLEEIDQRLRPGGLFEVEFFSARSLLYQVTGKRWAGYDWAEHHSIANPVGLSDFMGLQNYRLVRESQLSWAYSVLVAVQSFVNVLMPWQRNALYDWLKGRQQRRFDQGWALASVLLGCVLLPLSLLVEVCGALIGRGSVARQRYRKMVDAGSQKASNSVQ